MEMLPRVADPDRRVVTASDGSAGSDGATPGGNDSEKLQLRKLKASAEGPVPCRYLRQRDERGGDVEQRRIIRGAPVPSG